MNLADRHASLQEFMRMNPNIEKKDLLEKSNSIRRSMRDEVTKFLTPEQIKKWDSTVASAKEFLGQSVSRL